MLHVFAHQGTMRLPAAGLRRIVYAMENRQLCICGAFESVLRFPERHGQCRQLSNSAAAGKGINLNAPLTELTRVAVDGGLDALFAGVNSRSGAPPETVERQRDSLRLLGLDVEKGKVDRGTAMVDAKASLNDEHPLVRLAAIHTVARIAEYGDSQAWEAISFLTSDTDVLVQVGAVRAVGRIARVHDMDALTLLQKVHKETKDDSVRCAARDAATRVQGLFSPNAPGNLFLTGHA